MSTPRRPGRMRGAIWLAVAGLIVAGALVAFVSGQSSTAPDWRRADAIVDGRDADPWSSLLGGENSFAQDMAKLNDPTNSDLEAPVAREVAQLARAVTHADVSGEDRNRYAAYFPARQPGSDPLAFCRDVVTDGAGAASVEAGPSWAQALVYWSGSCPNVSEGRASGRVRLYLHRTGAGWQPVRDVLVPGQAPAEAETVAPPLVAFSACGDGGNREHEARREVVQAFGRLCRDAQAAGVRLEIASAYRSPAEQADLWQEAIKAYGSQAEAARWVAYSDGTMCESRHCAGAAVSLRWNKKVARWLEATVGCSNPNDHSVRLGPTRCEEGEQPVRRVHRYGFAAPLDAQPWYLELAIPLDSDSDCAAPSAAASVPEIIVATFRCRVGTDGGVGAERVAAEALVVARCSSGFDPSARVNGGRFATQPDPTTGAIDDRAGLFALTGAQAASFSVGGINRRFDPIAAADGAARLYLAEAHAGRWGWGPFACAGALPGRDGPLPEWATAWTGR